MIKVQDLGRRFGDFQAVTDMSFEVPEGEIFGFIGPNGAGKTTTIRILATLLLPTSGKAEILGYDVTEYPEKVREILGYMPDSWGVYPDITVVEYLEFFAAAYGIPRKERRRSVDGVMALTDLRELEDKLVVSLSKGMKQRLCLAKTLVHDPRLLVLDEPADGLDPRARIELRELLRELADMGKTILISSHILTELSDLVTSVGIVERGRILMSGDVKEIIERLVEGGEAGQGDDGEVGTLRRFVLRTTVEALEATRELLDSRPDLRDVSAVGAREVAFAHRGTEAQVAEVVRSIVQGGTPLLELVERRADLEDVFMAITKGEVQ